MCMPNAHSWSFNEGQALEGQALAYEVVEYLAQHGFRLAGVYHMTYDRKGIAVQADFLFNHGKDGG